MKTKEPKKEAKDGENNRLRRQLERKNKEIAKLKREIKHLEKGVGASKEFLKGTVEGIQMDRLIEGAKKGKDFRDIKEEVSCPKCGGELKKLPKSTVGVIVVCGTCNFRKVEKE